MDMMRNDKCWAVRGSGASGWRSTRYSGFRYASRNFGRTYQRWGKDATHLVHHVCGQDASDAARRAGRYYQSVPVYGCRTPRLGCPFSNRALGRSVGRSYPREGARQGAREEPTERPTTNTADRLSVQDSGVNRGGRIVADNYGLRRSFAPRSRRSSQARMGDRIVLRLRKDSVRLAW
jgi:hypothetical protein